MVRKRSVIAVSTSEAAKYGCPYCGGVFGHSPMLRAGSEIWICTHCHQTSVHLLDGIEKSTVGVAGYYPILQPHPRRGQPVDRAGFIANSEQSIGSVESMRRGIFLPRLGYWLLLGHSQPVRIAEIGERDYLATDGPGNVLVTWFGDKDGSRRLGIELKQPIPATLLYPISTIFDRYGVCGYVNPQGSPPLVNFRKAYYNRRPISVFGGNCGGCDESAGIVVALTIRYLEEVSELNARKIPSKSAELKSLARCLGLEVVRSKEHDDLEVQEVPEDIFERVSVDEFDRPIGDGSSVHIVMKEGVFLPPLPLPAEIFVDVKDTALDSYIPADVQERPTKSMWSRYLIYKVPARLLRLRNDERKERQDLYGGVKYPLHHVYMFTNVGTREFTFHVPNVLDAVLTAFFFTKVLAPVLREAQQAYQSS